MLEAESWMVARSRKEEAQMSEDPTAMNNEGAWESSGPEGSWKTSKHEGSTTDAGRQDRRTTMNQTGIIKQAWNTLIRYRALWIFGAILALTTASVASVLTWLPDNEEPRFANG
jgi:hypothetical protein